VYVCGYETHAQRHMDPALVYTVVNEAVTDEIRCVNDSVSPEVRSNENPLLE